MNETENLLREYMQQFDEAMPLNIVYMTDEQLLAVLKDCLKSGKPYELPEDVKCLIKQGVDF